MTKNHRGPLLFECLQANQVLAYTVFPLSLLLVWIDWARMSRFTEVLPWYLFGTMCLLNTVRTLWLRAWLQRGRDWGAVAESATRVIEYKFGGLTLIIAVTWSIWILNVVHAYGFERVQATLALVMLCGIAANGALAMAAVGWVVRGYIGLIIGLPLLAMLASQPLLAGMLFLHGCVLWLNAGRKRRHLAESLARQAQSDSDRALLRSVVDAVPGYVSLLDNQLAYRLLNRRLVTRLGFNEGDLLGLKLGVNDPDSAFTLKVREFAASDKTVLQERVRMRVGSREKRWHLLNATKVSRTGDVVCISIDIHHEVMLDEQNARQRAQIENSAKMAALGEMAGGMAHEINNPLAIVLGKTNQLKRRIEAGQFTKEQCVTDLTQIERTGERIAQIIRALRTFSRSGERDPFKPVSLVSILENALALCTERFKHSEVTLEVAPPPDVVISCREVQICQVLVNLLLNAHDAVATAPVKRVKIEFAAAGEDLSIRVRDSGPGVPAALVDKIMQPFFTTKDVGKGSGLGLSISQGIAADHQGKLFLDRGEAETTFVLRLPMLSAAQRVA